MRAFAATGPGSAILSSPVSLTQQASRMPRIELDRQGAAHLSLPFMRLLPLSRLIAWHGLSALLLAAPLAQADELEAFCLEMASGIADNAPLSISVMKEQLRILAGAHPMSPQGFERIQGLRRLVYDSQDYREGRTAFMEKRKPVFQGR